MIKQGEIQKPNEGWMKLTDMLRASITCANTQEVLTILDLFDN